VRLKVDVPDDWLPAIDSARGERSIADYLRDLIRDDQPKKVRAKLSEPARRGRPKVNPTAQE
jgi:hypothetical protein